MKHFLATPQRWFAVLIVCLLLCGAGAVRVVAACRHPHSATNAAQDASVEGSNVPPAAERTTPAGALMAPDTSVCFAKIVGILDPTTVYSSADGSAVQTALNAAYNYQDPANTPKIKLAGNCVGVAGTLAVAVIEKYVVLEGGYDPANWNVAPDPVAHPTVLDAAGLQNGVKLAVSSKSATLRYLTITGASGAANGDGGGVSITGTSSAMTIEDCTITATRLSAAAASLAMSATRSQSETARSARM